MFLAIEASISFHKIKWRLINEGKFHTKRAAKRGWRLIFAWPFSFWLLHLQNVFPKSRVSYFHDHSNLRERVCVWETSTKYKLNQHFFLFLSLFFSIFFVLGSPVAEVTKELSHTSCVVCRHRSRCLGAKETSSSSSSSISPSSPPSPSCCCRCRDSNSGRRLLHLPMMTFSSISLKQTTCPLRRIEMNFTFYLPDSFFSNSFPWPRITQLLFSSCSKQNETSLLIPQITS